MITAPDEISEKFDAIQLAISDLQNLFDEIHSDVEAETRTQMVEVNVQMLRLKFRLLRESGRLRP